MPELLNRKDLCKPHLKRYVAAEHDLRDCVNKIQIAEDRGQTKYVERLKEDLIKRKADMKKALDWIKECPDCGYYG